MSKIDAYIKVTHNLYGRLKHEIYHIKLDGNGFPYVVFDNEKIILHRKEPKYYTKWIWGNYPVKVEFIDGYDKFVEILSNPELTVNKLTPKDYVRMG